MAWTEQQQNAIDIRNSSVIVSAAAGSGKTAVLTERLAQIISDRTAMVRADRIIVVTFTNDAASELRKRLDAKLRELIVNDPGNNYLMEQQTLLQGAKISTINSFCFELLRDNITEQGITAGFSVLDESDNELIKSQAMDELLEYYSGNEYEKISYIYDKFCLKNDTALIEVINLIDKYLSSAAMREKWLDDAVKAFACAPDKSVYFSKIKESAVKKLKKAYFEVEQRSEMLDDIFEDMEKKAAVNYANQIEEDKLLIQKALSMAESGRILKDEEISEVTSFPRQSAVRRTEDINVPILEACNAKRKMIIQLVCEAMQGYINFEEDFEECRIVTEILAEMLKKYYSLIWEKKCEKNALSFDDGERLVLELLADKDESGNIVQSEAAKRIADYYDIIMIDEYQDSNNKQDMIFKLISKDYHFSEEGNPLYGSNAFVVGDVKQSIYKFRLANPQNFISTMKNSVQYTGDSEYHRNYSVTLNKNFRSSPQVIDYVNFLFTQIMSEECGDVDYNSDEMLYFGAAEYDKDNDNLTHIAFINTDSSEGEEDDEESTEIHSQEHNPEAVYTALKIRTMLESQKKVILKDGRKRPCEPKDFCILIRKNRYANDYIKELENLGIEAKGEEVKGYLDSREISVLIDLLRIIDNPLLEVPFAAVMLSPMYMFELEELAFIKSLDKEQSLFVIMSGIINGEYNEECDMFFADRCREFLKSLNRFRLIAVTMTVSELIGRIYDDTDFISVMQLYTDGEKKRANLRALIQYAKNYERSVSYEGSGGLSGFVRYIDRVLENGSDFVQGKNSASTGNYVSVKTIHKSKGLEYPFIFLAETSSKIKNDTPPVICSDDSRIGYVLYDQKLVRRYRTSAYNQIIQDNSKEILSEEMRLLYVGVTRAKQKLFINLKCSERRLKSICKLLTAYWQEGENIRAAAVNAKCHGDWIWMSLFEHKEFKEVFYQYDILSEGAELPSAKIIDRVFDIEFVEPDKIGEKSIQKPEYHEALPNIKVYEELNGIINWEYDRTLSEMPAKLSVTQITKKIKGDAENLDIKLKRPKFAEEEEKLTGTERGTAIHTFFQYCDFENAQNDIESEIRRMAEKGYISVPQAKSINRENVRAFFGSSLFKRISESKEVYREKKFMVAASDMEMNNEIIKVFKKSDGMIKGIIDIAFMENGKLIIVDYKSDHSVSAERLAERYKTQLELYSHALEITTDYEVSELYLYSFELRREIKIDI